MAAIARYPLVQTLPELRGNPRPAVLTETVFGIPDNMYRPYLSVDMVARLSRALESHEQARLSALVYAVPLLLTTPLGWIAGRLSAIDRALPFVLNMLLFAIGSPTRLM